MQTPSETIHYAYDDDNIRVSATVNGETTSYLLDKNRPYAQVLAEYTNGNLDASYIYGLDLISQERNGTDSYYLVDGLGSTRGLTDENGNVTDVYYYDAYGNLTDSVGNSENDYLFAGEQFDESLDQYYLRQRYYDPSIGRFTRKDTYEGNNFDPITLHKYLYANANPINGIDPSGLFTLTEVAAARQVRNTLAQAQLHSYVKLVRHTDPDGLGGKVFGFIDGFISFIEGIQFLTSLKPLFTTTLGAVSSTSKVPLPKLSIIPSLPDLSKIKPPISVDEAIELAEKFLVDGAPVRVLDKDTGLQFIQEYIDASGRRITRRVGVDINPSTTHVKNLGPHLNLQTQINGTVQKGKLKDPHIPINPATIKPSDY